MTFRTILENLFVISTLVASFVVLSWLAVLIGFVALNTLTG